MCGGEVTGAGWDNLGHIRDIVSLGVNEEQWGLTTSALKQWELRKYLWHKCEDMQSMVQLGRRVLGALGNWMT